MMCTIYRVLLNIFSVFAVFNTDLAMPPCKVAEVGREKTGDRKYPGDGARAIRRSTQTYRGEAMDTKRIHVPDILTLLLWVFAVPILADSAKPVSDGGDISIRAHRSDTDPLRASASKCAEPPIIRKETPTKEETQRLLMRVISEPDSVKGELFLPMYLEEHDVPGKVKMTQDTRSYLPLKPEDNALFVKHCGYHRGLALWVGGFDQTVWRLVDIRWVLPTENEAKAYHKATIQGNSEGQPRVSGAPVVGNDCQVFGGTFNVKGKPLTHYYYIFRVQNVVVKLYVAQGPDVVNPDRRLTPAKVADIARICVHRIEKYNRAATAKSHSQARNSSPKENGPLSHQDDGRKMTSYKTASEIVGIAIGASGISTGDAHTLPVPSKENSKLEIIMLLYREPTRRGDERIFPPHQMLAIDPMSGTVLRNLPCNPKMFGIDQTAHIPYVGFGLDPSMSAEVFWNKYDRFMEISSEVWKAYASGASNLSPQSTELVREYQEIFNMIGKKPLLPYYRAVAPDFFKWLEHVTR
ncbi:MAG: hypothetical protein GX443_14440 [Deltaproteobacteria bacterium]|nr:hypothetical protein [Deltaproteobacteria bacterium]